MILIYYRVFNNNKVIFKYLESDLILHNHTSTCIAWRLGKTKFILLYLILLLYLHRYIRVTHLDTWTCSVVGWTEYLVYLLSGRELFKSGEKLSGVREEAGVSWWTLAVVMCLQTRTAASGDPLTALARSESSHRVKQNLQISKQTKINEVDEDNNMEWALTFNWDLVPGLSILRRNHADTMYIRHFRQCMG